jgi:hypothetical protein
LAKTPSNKIEKQIKRARLPTGGTVPFVPKLSKNRQDDERITKRAVPFGPRRGKKGFVDENDRIWIRDRAHSGYPDHWDVQLDGGQDYLKVDYDGNKL